MCKQEENATSIYYASTLFSSGDHYHGFKQTKTLNSEQTIVCLFIHPLFPFLLKNSASGIYCINYLQKMNKNEQMCDM